MKKDYSGTKYEEIYENFIGKITDYDLISLEETDMYRLMLNYLKSAIANFPECKELQYRDDSIRRFKCNLSPLVQEALAALMLEQWVSPKLYNIMNMKQFLSDSEYKHYSQANHLEKLQNLKDFSNSEAERLKVQYGNQTMDITELR